MSTYDRHLPQVFSYAYQMPKEHVRDLVVHLANNVELPALSSFAVVSGVLSPRLWPTLYLSNVSNDYLLKDSPLWGWVEKDEAVKVWGFANDDDE
jgi:hypothetical protein